MIQLNNCIALLNQYPAGSEQGIENFLAALKGKITQLTPPKSTNGIIRNYETATNTLTQKTLLQ